MILYTVPLAFYILFFLWAIALSVMFLASEPSLWESILYFLIVFLTACYPITYFVSGVLAAIRYHVAKTLNFEIVLPAIYLLFILALLCIPLLVGV